MTHTEHIEVLKGIKKWQEKQYPNCPKELEALTYAISVLERCEVGKIEKVLIPGYAKRLSAQAITNYLKGTKD